MTKRPVSFLKLTHAIPYPNCMECFESVIANSKLLVGERDWRFDSLTGRYHWSNPAGQPVCRELKAQRAKSAPSNP